MFLLALALAAAPAADNRPVNVYEFPGTDSCGDWTANRRNRGGATQALEGWVLGFVSAYNFYGEPSGNVAPDVSALALLAWTDVFCQAHPLDNIAQAGLKLVKELKIRQRR